MGIIAKLLGKKESTSQSKKPSVTPHKVQTTAKKKTTSINKPMKKNTPSSSLLQVKHTIAVASGKGGVGKSSCAVNLAVTLQKQGYKVGLLDADIYGPSIGLMTGAKDPQVMEGDLIVPPVAWGVKVISASMFGQKHQAHVLRGPMVAQFVKQLLTSVAWGSLDYLIIDYPPGTGDTQLTLSQQVTLSGAVIVTTPQEVALQDVYKCLDMFNTLHVPVLGILENMSFFVCDGCDKKHTIFSEGGAKKLVETYGFPLLGTLPLKASFADACEKGKPSILEDKEPEMAKLFEMITENMTKKVKEIESLEQGCLKSFHLKWRKAS